MKKEFSQITEGKPQELRLEIKCAEHLNCRVVRGTKASVRIPEFGLCLDPASGSQSFVTNVEGLLQRFKDAIQRANVLFSDDKSHEEIEKLEVLLNHAAAGEEPFTILISDPLGQSRLGD
jgi:zinc finger protein